MHESRNYAQVFVLNAFLYVSGDIAIVIGKRTCDESKKRIDTLERHDMMR